MKWNVEDTFSWLRRDHSASKEDYMVSVLLGKCGDRYRTFWRQLPLSPLTVPWKSSLEMLKNPGEPVLAM